MKVTWAPQALRDRAEIFDYIQARNADAAVRFDNVFEKAAKTLSKSPRLGKPGEIAETREWKAHRNYRIVYEVTVDAVHILMVIHAARLWPPPK